MSFFEDEVREGFYITAMMKRYWAAQLQVLARIDEVCKKHGIRWFADCGTLIGAVRHGGYIPWDDDLDICMLRHDYEAFFRVAKEELPRDYRVLSLYTEEEYNEPIGRVVNSDSIRFSPEHLKANFGCPYTAGIDIFPLDALADDEEEEEKRRSRAKKVLDALELVRSGQADSPECKALLSDIESTEHVILHRRGNLIHELLLTADRLYRLYHTEDAKAVALMPFWVRNHDHRYPKEWYDGTLRLPFENVSICVPVGYEDVLRTEYGEFMRTVRGGGAHDYPVYKAQERILKENMGHNPYRYTMPAVLPPEKKSKSLIESCNEIISVILKAHHQIKLLCDGNDYENAGQLMEGCLTLVDSLEKMLAGAGMIQTSEAGPRLDTANEMIKPIGEYRSLLYEISGNWRGEESVAALNAVAEQIGSAIEKMIAKRRRQVLFLVYKAKWWMSMEPCWEKEKTDPDTDVFVMALPYMISDPIGENGETFDDRQLFPGEVKMTSVEEYDINARRPDVIYIQAPYDGWNVVFRVPEHFYSEKLRDLTKELIYVPFMKTDDPSSPDDKLTEALKVIIEQPAVYYADKVILGSEKMKDVYVGFLKSITGEKSEKYWQDKIYVV